MSAPARIFDWKAIPSWSDTIAEVVPPDNRAALIAHITESAPSFKYRDDVYLFENIYGDFGGFDSLLDRFAVKFPSAFPFVRMYHCCRCVDPNSYLQKGMLVLNPEEAGRTFAELYLDNPRFPGVTETDMAVAVQTMAGSYKREGQIYFGLDDRFLVNHCKHYLTHGSEYCQGLAAALDTRLGFDIKSDLTRRGTPTVFCVRMPIDRIMRDTLRELGQNAFYAWAYGIVRKTPITWEIDFAIETDRPLPAEFIIEHYSPSGL